MSELLMMEAHDPKTHKRECQVNGFSTFTQRLTEYGSKQIHFTYQVWYRVFLTCVSEMTTTAIVFLRPNTSRQEKSERSSSPLHTST